MTETDLSDLRRRVSLLEEEMDSEKRVTRHILRKVTENESLLFDLRAEVGEVRKEVTALRNDLTLLRADLPGIISTVVGALLREMQERKT